MEIFIYYFERLIILKFKSKKLILSAGLVCALALPGAVSAYSKSYSFDIHSSVTGSTDHDLSAKATSTTAKGNTYDASHTVQSSKSSYTVGIQKLLKAYITNSIPADGSSYTKSLGTISSGTYNVYINKKSSTGYYVKGSGTINQ